MAQSGIVTFLFTDLTQSTRHLQQAGEDAGHRLFRAHHKLMSRAVATNGGEELEWLGDGILAAFTSAADAVRCSVAIQQTARRPTANVQFEIRIGIHAGEAMRRDNGYFGTSVVTARRLCDSARPGQILCSRLIVDLLASRETFGFRDLGEMRLKGLDNAVAVSEVLYHRNDPSALLSQTPFVGRGDLLDRLSLKLKETTAGTGTVAFLLGEPGIGKTRLIEEFADLAVQQGAIVLRGACVDGEWQAPCGPFGEAILQYFHERDTSKVLAQLGPSAAVLTRIAPALGEKLGALAEPAQLEKDEERFRLLDAVAQFLIAVAREKPLVLVLDDLHWADRGTIAILVHVTHFLVSNPILLIGAYRDAEVDRTHPLSAAVATIRRTRGFERYILQGLPHEALGEMLAMIGDSQPPQNLVDALAAETAGNPLFIREVLLHLFEDGKILRDGQDWEAQPTIDFLSIPEGVRAVIRQRLSRLSEHTRELLKVGAAFNGAFPFDVASAVAQQDESTALSALDEALDAHLLRPGAGAETFDFTHALIRHTLYADLSPPRRARLHRKIAEEMERVWGDLVSKHAAEVAYQFWRAGAVPGAARGVEYAIAAADNAEAAYAHDEVAAFLQIALELLPRSDSRRQQLLARLGLSLPWTQKHQEALNVAREAAELLKSTQGTDAAANYLEEVARAMHSAGMVRPAWELARDGLRLVENRRDITWASLTKLDLSRLDAEDPSNPGVPTVSSPLLEMRKVLKGCPRTQLQTRRINPPFESREEVLNDEESSATLVTLMGGDFRRGLQLFQAQATEGERQGRIAWAMSGWCGVAVCHAALGDLTLAQAAYDRAISLYVRSARSAFPSIALIGLKFQMLIAFDSGWEEFFYDPQFTETFKKPVLENRWSHALVRAVYGFVLARLGYTDLSLAQLASLPPALEVGAYWDISYGPMVCDAAAALWMLECTTGSTLIERTLLEKVIAPDFRFPMRDARLSVARLCALEGRYEEACEWFSKARAVLDEQGARPLRAIADYDQALMYLRRAEAGDPSKARSFLDSALTQFRELRLTGWIERAERTVWKRTQGSSALLAAQHKPGLGRL